MSQDNFDELLSTLNQQSTLSLMDKKIIKPFNVPGTHAFENYRTKIVKDQSGNELLRVDYDPSGNSQGGGFLAKLQQFATGMLNFKIGDLDGNYIYSVKVDKFMATTHNFSIMNGDGTEGKFTATHKLMSLGRESLVVFSMDGSPVLSTEYRGYKKFIEVTDGNGNPAAALNSPIMSTTFREKWQLDFTGQCDRSLVLIMASIMSELGQR